jgi:hypothetical protein
MILDILQKSKETKTLIGFNFYGSDNGFYCGFVLDYSEVFVIIQHYSKFGINDGILVHKLTDIKYFETETDYLNGIQLLIDKPNEILGQTFKLGSDKEYLDSFTSLFENFIGNKDYFIKFEMTDDEIYFGLIEWCDEDSFSIKNIDSAGIITGKAIFKFEDLKLYWIDDLECRKRKILYDKKNASS